MTELHHGPNKVDNLVTWGCILLFIAFLISLPFMVRDKNARLEHEWKTQGCQMYDESMINKVPAKCQQEFIDHYKSQQTRVQPPDENSSN